MHFVLIITTFLGLECLYEEAGEHSTKVGETLDGTQDLFGKWEDYSQQDLPSLDACGGHFGITPESDGETVYHYHVQDKAPFTFGCYGPNSDGSVVTLAQCKALYSDCDQASSTISITTSFGTFDYNLWCPCFDWSWMESDPTSKPSSEPTAFSPKPTSFKATQQPSAFPIHDPSPEPTTVPDFPEASPAPLLGDVGFTTTSGTDEYTGQSFVSGENICEFILRSSSKEVVYATNVLHFTSCALNGLTVNFKQMAPLRPALMEGSGSWQPFFKTWDAQ